MSAYYNENDPFCAQWLRNLIAAGHIAAGDVDERSIVDIKADDLDGYRQCHFFAGIGGWSYALRLAEWPDDRPVWTGSCPCQPFSMAGENKAHIDERHLWPAWLRLIRERKPSRVLGEQVDGTIPRLWLDHVLADLENAGYAAGAANLPAGCYGANHVRARLWFVGTSDTDRIGCEESRKRRENAINDETLPFRQTDRLVDAIRRNDLPYVCEQHDGVSVGVEQMRAYGNAIVPQVAAEFIKAVMDCYP